MNEPGILQAGMMLEPLETRFLPSRSRPESPPYEMVRYPGGWSHVDSRCDGWTYDGHCRHVKELNMEENGDSTQALVVFERAEDRAIVARISGQITRDWVYRFNVGGKEVTGLAVDGVEAAARECAKMGEAIREIEVRCEFEDEREARFVARAGRYAVNADGVEVLLDVAIRAKRQPKYMKRRDGPEQFDEFWYEKGVTKAVRNAKEALLPEAVKAEIMARAEADGRVQRVQGDQTPKRRPASHSPPHDPTPRRVYHAPAAEAEPEPEIDPETGEILSPGAAPEEAGTYPVLKSNADLFNAGLKLGFKSKAEMLKKLGLESEMEIADRLDAYKRLVEMAPQPVKEG